MKLEPFSITKERCPSCGTNDTYNVSYCDMDHLLGRQMRGSQRPITDAQTFASDADPHLHVTCRTCGYERIAETFSVGN
jgi:hypothetical protein